MATTTTNLGLTQPDAAEGYDIAVFNTNAELIDEAVGALQNELGGTGGGLGKKVDTLLENVAAVKTDTEALAQALASANQNIATLLTQRSGVKTVYNGTATTSASTGYVDVSIPTTMDQTKCIVYVPSPVTWRKNGATINFGVSGGPGQTFNYQIIEFY